MPKGPIVLAVDTPDLPTAIEWVKATQESVSVFKLGLEFFLTFGSKGVKAIREVTDSEIFLDLKLHYSFVRIRTIFLLVLFCQLGILLIVYELSHQDIV